VETKEVQRMNGGTREREKGKGQWMKERRDVQSTSGGSFNSFAPEIGKIKAELSQQTSMNKCGGRLVKVEGRRRVRERESAK
jgi:hypothetical protein